MPLFLRTSIIKRYSRRGRRHRRPQACSWLSFFCDAAHHRVVGDADPYDPKRKKPVCHRSPTPRTILPQPMHQLQLVSGDSPQKMTLGDSVNIVKGHFHSVLVSNIFGYLAFCWIRPFALHNGYAKLVFFRRFFEGLFWLLLSWEPLAYLYIGITSLYLNHSTLPWFLQDGIFHKSARKLL